MLSPFPAARRVLGIGILVGLLAARHLGRNGKTNPWGTTAAIAWGILLLATDAWDANAERAAVTQVDRQLPPQREARVSS